MQNEAPPYNLDPGFEAAIVVFSCTSPRFWGSIHDTVDPSAFPTQAARDAISAVRAHYKETGSGPAKPILVLQRLRDRIVEGEMTMDRVSDVNMMIESAQDAGLPEQSDVLEMFSKILKDREVQKFTTQVIQDSAKGPKADLRSWERGIHKIDRIGSADFSLGSMLSIGSLDRIRTVQASTRLELGIPPVDDALGGGVGVGLTMLSAGINCGKSMFSCHIGTHNFLSGLHVLYLSIGEMMESEIELRMIANITGIAINDLARPDEYIQQLAAQRLSESLGTHGFITVKFFNGRNTTLDTILSWIDEYEQAIGSEAPLIIVDPLQRAKKGGASGGSSYLDQGDVFNGARDFAIERRKFLVVTDQPQRGAKRQKRIDTEDSSDSIEKPRIADIMVTMTAPTRHDDAPDEEWVDTVNMFIAKSRVSKAGIAIDGIETDFARARPYHFQRNFPTGVW